MGEKKQDYLFIKGNLKERQPIFDGLMNYYLDNRKEVFESVIIKESEEIGETRKNKIIDYSPPCAVKENGNLIDKNPQPPTGFDDSMKPNYYLSALVWRRTQAGIHCEKIGEFYPNNDFQIDGENIVVIYKATKCHIPKFKIIDFNTYDTLNFKFD